MCPNLDSQRVLHSMTSMWKSTVALDLSSMMLMVANMNPGIPAMNLTVGNQHRYWHALKMNQSPCLNYGMWDCIVMPMRSVGDRILLMNLRLCYLAMFNFSGCLLLLSKMRWTLKMLTWSLISGSSYCVSCLYCRFVCIIDMISGESEIPTNPGSIHKKVKHGSAYYPWSSKGVSFICCCFRCWWYSLSFKSTLWHRFCLVQHSCPFQKHRRELFLAGPGTLVLVTSHLSGLLSNQMSASTDLLEIQHTKSHLHLAIYFISMISGMQLQR